MTEKEFERFPTDGLDIKTLREYAYWEWKTFRMAKYYLYQLKEFKKILEDEFNE